MYGTSSKSADTREACFGSHASPGFNPSNIANPNKTLELQTPVQKPRTVPLSIKSNFVQTPMVRSPAGSTSFAIFNASEFARSEFA
jgi:hypothetical protein